MVMRVKHNHFGEALGDKGQVERHASALQKLKDNLARNGTLGPDVGNMNSMFFTQQLNVLQVGKLTPGVDRGTQTDPSAFVDPEL